MAIDQKYLSKLVCPTTLKPLRLATEAELCGLNRAIEAGGIVNAGGKAVSETIAEGLVLDDDDIIYPILDGIPKLLAEDAIRLNADPKGSETEH